MAENFLQLNQDKTEVLIIGPEGQREKRNPKLRALALKPCQRAKNLGVIFDMNPSFEKHISNITKNAFYDLKNIGNT